MSASPAALRRLRLLLGAMLALASSPAAVSFGQAVSGEYFFGEDPGVGSATPLPPVTEPVTPPLFGSLTPLALPLPAAPGEGVVLGLRFRGPFGEWGPTVLRRIYLLESSAGPARLYHALDRRPDPATASFVELTEAHRLAPAPLPLALGDVAPGFHSLHLQLRDANGAHTEAMRFIHVTPSRVQTLAGLAYTFRDAEGSSTAISVAPLAATSGPQDVSIPAPASLAPGDYTLVLNLADAAGDLLAAAPLAPVALRAATFAAYETWADGQDLDGADAAPLADPDADGLVNLLEYAFGGSPHAADTPALYTVTPSRQPSGYTMITVRYRQREGGVGVTGADYTAGGLRYTVEASTDLQTWRPYAEIPGIAAHVNRDPTGRGIEFVDIELFPDSALSSAGRIFVRLNVSVAP